MLNLLLWASDKQTIVEFAKKYKLIVRPGNLWDEEGEDTPKWVNRPGFEYAFWDGSGVMKIKEWDIRSTREVSLSENNEFAFEVPGGNFPTWLDESVALRDFKVVGLFKRTQGNFAIFKGAATIGETLDIGVQDTQFLNGFVVVTRFTSEALSDDQIIEDDTLEPWEKSKIAKFLKDNGTPGTIQGINYFELDSVRILRPRDVKDFLELRGIKMPIFAGGNRY